MAEPAERTASFAVDISFSQLAIIIGMIRSHIEERNPHNPLPITLLSTPAIAEGIVFARQIAGLPIEDGVEPFRL